MNSLTRKRGCLLWHQRQPCSGLFNRSKLCLSRPQTSYRYSTSHTHHPEEYTSLQRTRNIGIIAHIDAVRDLEPFSATIANILIGKDDDHRAYALLQWLHASNRRYGLIFMNCITSVGSTAKNWGRPCPQSPSFHVVSSRMIPCISNIPPQMLMMAQRSRTFFQLREPEESQFNQQLLLSTGHPYTKELITPLWMFEDHILHIRSI